MKFKYLSRIVFAMFSAVLSTGCGKEPAPFPEEETDVFFPELRLKVSEMTMSADTRALGPISPDIEKYVTTLAIIEFDNEGLHVKGESTYHFIDFLKGTVDGVENVGNIDKTEFGIVRTELTGLKFKQYTKATICLVANVTEQQVLDYYTECSAAAGSESYGHMSIDQFQDWSLPFKYKVSDMTNSGYYDESVSGHLEQIYMFGYYEGPVTSEDGASISVDLGRLASRIDLTVVNETGEEINKRLAYHFDNVCSSAYFFPMKKSMPPTEGPGQSRTVICCGVGTPIMDQAPGSEVPETFPAGKSHTRYFYTAAHSAKDFSEATKMHLIWNSSMSLDDTSDAEGGKETWVPMCNINPSDAASVLNGYSLSRNTRYHFTVRLRKSVSAQASTKAAEISYRNGNSPGEFIVYLP